MMRIRNICALALLALLAVTAGQARAERTPSRKALDVRTPGPRGDLTVSATTNGISTLGVANGVGPAIKSAQLLSEPEAPRVGGVYNIPFYGAGPGPSAAGVGATLRPANSLRKR